jgi:hypothetical protein
MQRSSSPLLWVALAASLLLIPWPAWRFLLNLLGGLTLLALLLPLLAIGAFLLAWQFIYPRLIPCPACGIKSFGNKVCPACGTDLGTGPGPQRPPHWLVDDGDAVSAAQVTIDVEAVDVSPPAAGDQRRPPTA